MNNQEPYLPILKYKVAEIRALRNLNSNQKINTNPMFSLVPKQRTDTLTRQRTEVPKEEILHNLITDSEKYLPDMKIFVDVQPLFSFEEKNSAFLSLSSSQSLLFENNFTPVLRLKDLHDGYFDSTVKEFFIKKGICLRILKEELTSKFWANIDADIKNLGLDRNSIDIVFDYGITDSSNLNHFVEQIDNDTNLDEWRSFYFVTGCFPVDLSAYHNPGTYYIDRLDWKLWLEIRKKMVGKRLPGYGDFTIQHPIYRRIDGFPNISYSIRYTDETQWPVMKGQARNAKNNAGSQQYPAHSQLLIDLGLFKGNSCCKGCAYIEEISQKSSGKFGGPTEWLQAGINHHIALTLRQIANLYAKSDSLNVPVFAF